MSDLVKRRLTSLVQQRIREEPVLVLTGPRSVGKSTLLRSLAASAQADVIDFDNVDVRAAAANDPTLFAAGSSPVLIDEFQHVPELLDAIKAELHIGQIAQDLCSAR